jgi:hypothetical protein
LAIARYRYALYASEHDHPGCKRVGVRVMPGDQLDANTTQTLGVNHAAALNLSTQFLNDRS